MKKHYKILFYLMLVISGLLFFWGETVPAIILTNVFIAFYTGRYSLKFTFPGFIPLFAFLAYFQGFEAAAFIALFILPAFILGACICFKSTFSVLLMSTSATALFAFTAYTRFLSDKLDIKPVDFLFGSTLEEIKQIFIAQEMIPSEFGTDALSLINTISDVLQTMLPAFYILLSVLFSYLIFVFVRYFLEKSGMQLAFPRFYELGFSKSVSMIFLLLFLISMFANSPILINVVSVMFTLHVVCGISFVDYILIQRKMSKIIRLLLLGVIIVFSGLMGGFMTTILCCFGMNNSVRFSRK